MRFILMGFVFLSVSFAQEAPEGYVSIEAIEKLFKVTQGGSEVSIGELSPLFKEQGVAAPAGLEPVASIQQDYSMGMVGAPQQLNARAYFEVEADVSLEPFRAALQDDGWTNLETFRTGVWGFVSSEELVRSGDYANYGNFCRNNATLYYNVWEGLLDLNLDVYGEDVDMCEQQRAQTEEFSDTSEITVPELKLSAPSGSKTLVAEPLTYAAIPKSTVQDVDLPGGWSSRATLSTTLAPARVLAHYNMQMQQAGWTRGRSNADELNTWSEWTFTDESGQKWLATVNVTHNEAFENLLMPLLVVLTVD
jgi:hypothetical protein